MTRTAAATAPELAIRAILDDLLLQRRRLEHEGAQAAFLAANGRAIAYWHERLAGGLGQTDSGYTATRPRM
jgi:hypothetical protein